VATKKREIYARMATQLRHHERCAIAEKACPGAMGLYAFLLMQARGEGTRGDTLEDVAYAAWGAPIAYRKKQAAALIKSGLVVKNGDRLEVVKYLDHNDGPEEIAANKAKSKKRYEEWDQRQKASAPTEDKRVCNALSSISISHSLSSESRSRDPDSTPRAPDAPPSYPHNDAPEATVPTTLVELGIPVAEPAWWPAAVATASAVRPISEPKAMWLKYRGAMARKRWAPSQSHAVGWLVEVAEKASRNAPAREQQGGASAAARRPFAPRRTGTES